MVGTHTGTETTVDAFLRAGTTSSWTRQRRVVDRLNRLEEAGEIDRYRVQVWGPAAPVAGSLSEIRFHRAATGTVGRFEEWADERDAETGLPFEHEEVVCEFTDEHHQVVRLPVVCLAVYEGEELVGVYPHVEEGEQRQVEDLLAELGASGGSTDSGSDATRTVGPHEEGTRIGGSNRE